MDRRCGCGEGGGRVEFEPGSIANVLLELDRVRRLYADIERLTAGRSAALKRSSPLRTAEEQVVDGPDVAGKGKMHSPLSNTRPTARPDSAGFDGALSKHTSAVRAPAVTRKATDTPLPRSSYCHVCARTGSATRVVGCVGYTGKAKCRKVYCDRCVQKNGEDAEHLDESIWLCFHCRCLCPPNARCRIYSRVNAKRARCSGSDDPAPTDYA